MNIRDENNRLMRPVFVADIPPQLLHNLSPSERWMYETTSISKQQQEWLITQHLTMDERQKKLERRMAMVVSVKWSSISAAFLLIVIPALLIAMGAWLTYWFNKKL